MISIESDVLVVSNTRRLAGIKCKTRNKTPNEEAKRRKNKEETFSHNVGAVHTEYNKVADNFFEFQNTTLGFNEELDAEEC